MDLVKKVNDGDYTYEELTIEQQCFIDGLRYSKEILNNMKYDYELSDVDSTLDKIQAEIILEFIESAIEMIHIEECEHIVAFNDENYVEQERRDEQKL